MNDAFWIDCFIESERLGRLWRLTIKKDIPEREKKKIGLLKQDIIQSYSQDSMSSNFKISLNHNSIKRAHLIQLV
jgi:hypothetical protein